MKLTISVIVVVCLSCVAIVQIIRNNALQSRPDFRERISPMLLLAVGVIVILGLIADSSDGTSCLFLDMMPAAAVLWLMTSSMWESDNCKGFVRSLIIMEVLLCLYQLGRIIGLFPAIEDGLAVWLMSLMTVFMIGLLVYEFTIRFLDVKTIMKQGTVWMIVTMAVDAIYVLFIIISSALWQIGAEVLGLLSMTGLIVALQVRIINDSEFVFWRKQERIIIESMKVTSVTSTVDGSRIDDVYKDLYERITALFEAEKPYLNNNLTINDIVKDLYSNKLYISRAISQFTGRNFCQFVNYYRVMHSIDSFRNNPEYKIHELANQSGFNSIVSYNMAFRLFMGENPSEWCRREKSNIIKKKK